jgi:hypothetical protein
MYNKMKRGLFGRKNGAMGVMPGDQPDYGMGDFPPMGGPQQQDPFPQRKGPFDTMPGQGFPQQAAPKQGFMSKLPGTMADIGSILDDDDNGQSMQFRQERAYNEQQDRAKAQAAQQAKMEQRDYDRSDYIYKDEYQRNNPDPAKPGTFEWYQTASEPERAAYDQYNPITVGTWNGPQRVPRGPAPGTVVNIKDLGGPNPSDPPAPSPSGGEDVLSRAQYEAMVQSLGAGGALNHIKKYNLRVGN